MTCNHPSDRIRNLTSPKGKSLAALVHPSFDKKDTLWCSVCGSLQEKGEWTLSSQEQSLRTAGWLWENPTEHFEQPTVVAAIKLVPNDLGPVELAYALRESRILFHVNRHYQHLNTLVDNVLQQQRRTAWGYTLESAVTLLPGMLARFDFEPRERTWEVRWLVKRLPRMPRVGPLPLDCRSGKW